MSDLPILRDASLFASGSSALVALVRWGACQFGWRRVWLPSYYCPEVPAALAATDMGGVQLVSYADHQLWAPIDVHSIPAVRGDAVVLANQLGVRSQPAAAHLSASGVALIEDHSHDLGSDWVRHSQADFAFASLRKTLPLPDGGSVWSPRGLALPPEPSVADEGIPPGLAAALRRRSERAASADRGIPFRAFARSAIDPAGSPSSRAISPVSRALLAQMPADAWREARRRNHALLISEVALQPGLRVLSAPVGGVPFAYTLVFDSPKQCRAARQSLIERAVVPAVIWPLDPVRHPGAGPADADLSSRILSIHCDQRYDEADMRRLGTIVRHALEAGR